MLSTSRALSFALVGLSIKVVIALVVRQSTTPLSDSQIAYFTPYTHFASTAYCQPDTTRSWTCGANCAANPDFVPVASGGNGDSVQFWYVGFSPSLKSVIVGHQGTIFSHLWADLTDLNVVVKPLDPDLFPGIGPSVLVHSGFANEQARTAKEVLAAVQTTISSHNATRVTVVGHSLGAAVALLDTAYLHLQSLGVPVNMIGYGMPRVGNPAFANWVDANLDIKHINNKKDPIPVVPPQFLGFRHPSGDIHINESGQWEPQPGQENPDELYSVGDVLLFPIHFEEHYGPYNGITMKCP